MARRVQEVTNGWAELASAIVLSAIKEKDEKFLNSRWFEFLKELVSELSKSKDDFYKVYL